MTTIVTDGRFIYSDRRMTVTSSGISDDPSFQVGAESSYVDNVKKLGMPTKEWRYGDRNVVAAGFAGEAPCANKMIDSLNHGLDLSMLKQVGSVLKTSLGFKTVSMVGILNTGDILKFQLRNGAPMRFDVFPPGEVIGCGSGASLVAPISALVHQPTAFELFVYACYIDRKSSLLFDYYDSQSGKIVRGSQLSERQIEHMLDKMQNKIKLYKGPKG